MTLYYRFNSGGLIPIMARRSATREFPRTPVPHAVLLVGVLVAGESDMSEEASLVRFGLRS